MLREAMLAFTLMGGANAMDGVTTHRAIDAGAVEYMAVVYGPRFERGVPVKAAITAAETGIFVAIRKHHKKTAWAFVATVVVVNGLAARHNENLARRLRGSGPR